MLSVRYSLSRQKILESLKKSSEPISTKSLLESFAKEDFRPNKSTIYRELDKLLDQDLVSELDFGEGQKRYEIKQNHHAHLICTKCGLIKCVNALAQNGIVKDFEDKLEGFKITKLNLEVFGLCQICDTNQFN